MNENYRNSELVDAPSLNGNSTLSDRVKELRLPGQLNPSRGSGGTGAATWLPWVLCVLLAVAWGSMGIRYYRNQPNAENTNPNSVTSVKGDSNTTPLPKFENPTKTEGEPKKSIPSDSVVLEGRGNIIPAHQISVSPVDVVGRIIELNIEEGKNFNEGDILAVIDSTKYKADFDLAKASSLASKARYEELKLSRELQIDQAEFEVQASRRSMEKAKNIYEINRRNYENRSKSVSEMEMMQSEKDYLGLSLQVSISEKKRDLVKGPARDEQIKAAEQDWKSAEARAAQAQWFLGNCTIKAPVTGVILTKKAERGNLINPVVGGLSTNLCEMADLSDLEVDLEIQERDLKKFHVGQACKVKPDAYPDRVYEAYVDRAMPIANRAKGVLPVRIKVIVPATEEQGQYLKPEMGVTVFFLNRDTTDPKWLEKTKGQTGKK
jgi:multidrug resistance efflux pump